MTTPSLQHTQGEQRADSATGGRRGAGLAFAVSLAAAFLALNVAVGWLERPLLEILRHNPDATLAQLNVLQPGQRYDVIFMGTSRAQFGFDPAAFSEEAARLSGGQVSAVNLGIPGTRLDLARLVLKNRILRGPKPALIVYGLSEFELWDPPGIDRVGDVTKLGYVSLVLTPEELHPYGGATLAEQSSFLADTILPLMRYRAVVRDALDLRFNTGNYLNGYVVDGPRQRSLRQDGLWTFPADWGQPTIAEDRRQAFQSAQRTTLSKLERADEREQQFLDFAALAKANGIRLLVINMPVDRSYINLWPSLTKLDEYRRDASQVARRADVPFVDLYDASQQLPPGAFWDDHHMSNGGAATFSRCITPMVLAALNGQSQSMPSTLSACRN